MANEEEGKKQSPPYIGFGTLNNFIDELKKTVMPTTINASFLHNKSGTVKSWLPSSLRFLDLIDVNGTPQQALKDLVAADEEDRKALYSILLHKHYKTLFESVDTKRGIQKEVNDWFVETYGISTSTVQKCNAFFLDLAKAAGEEVSPHFKKESTPRRPKKKTDAGSRGETPPPEKNAPPTQPQDYSVTLPALKARLILGIIEELPDPESEGFSETEIEEWLAYAKMTFKRVYGKNKNQPVKSKNVIDDDCETE